MIVPNDVSSGFTALLVEDDQIAREVLATIIGRKFPGVRLLMAGNGESGLELFREQRPDIVVTDINMPRMDGIRMSGEIRAICPETVIIILTAFNDAHYLLHAIELDINYYLMKPIDNRKLFRALERSIELITLKRDARDNNNLIRKLSLAVEHSPSMVMITDAGGAIEYVNRKFCTVTGYQPREVIGRNPKMFKSGTTTPDIYKNLWKTITAGREWRGEFQNRKKGGELYWEDASISPIPDNDGTITHFVAMKEDITEKKRAEEEIRMLNAHLAARARELESANQELETFNYTVSHDLRRPLTAISGYSQLILEMFGTGLNDQCRGYVKEIADGSVCMNQLIETLLDFSRITRCELKMETVDLSGIAGEVALDLRKCDPGRRVTFRIEEGVRVEGDADLLRVVLVNLMGNAWKYTGRKDDAVIEFGVVELEGKRPCFVRDNGAGFDMTHAAKLFSAFQRLHSTNDFEGTGIGLATVQRIIQRHGGTIWAEGAVGNGATFYFNLQ